MRAARIDRTHPEIAETFRRLGYSVVSLAQLGRGAPDLLVSKHQTVHLVECKTGKGKLRKGQEVFAKKFPVHVARTVQDALALHEQWSAQR